MKKMMKKAEMGITKPKSKVGNKYDSKILPPAGKQTSGDFMPKSYDTRFKPVPGGGDNYNGPKIGPREKTVGGMSKYGSKLKKAKVGGSFPDLNKDGKISQADILLGKGVIKAKMGKAVKKCKYGCK
jgi:hypothetical protein